MLEFAKQSFLISIFAINLSYNIGELLEVIMIRSDIQKIVDKENEYWFGDVPDFPDPSEMTDLQLMRCRFVNMTIEQNKAVIEELKKRDLLK